jgi:hypothetical protein
MLRGHVTVVGGFPPAGTVPEARALGAVELGQGKIDGHGPILTCFVGKSTCEARGSRTQWPP